MNKLRGTRSIGCKGKAGKEGGSKQGQTKKPKAEAEEDGGGQRTEKMRGTPGTPGTRGTGGGSRKDRKCIQEMHNTKKRPRNRFRSLLSSVPRRQGQPPGYYPIRRAAPQGFRPEPVPESQPGASWRAPRSQGHAPEVPWRPSKFRCCSLRRAPCPWRA